jgi:hypothetical protein
VVAVLGYWEKNGERESRKKRREGKEEGLRGAVEKLQGIASVARTASRRWPVSSRKPPRRSFL